jgi:hypothetical protein
MSASSSDPVGVFQCDSGDAALPAQAGLAVRRIDGAQFDITSPRQREAW